MNKFNFTEQVFKKLMFLNKRKFKLSLSSLDFNKHLQKFLIDIFLFRRNNYL